MIMYRYGQMYEARINPFAQFSQREKQRKYEELSVAEKITLSTTRMFLGNKFARCGDFVDFVLSVALVMLFVSFIVLLLGGLSFATAQKRCRLWGCAFGYPERWGAFLSTHQSCSTPQSVIQCCTHHLRQAFVNNKLTNVVACSLKEEVQILCTALGMCAISAPLSAGVAGRRNKSHAGQMFKNRAFVRMALSCCSSIPPSTERNSARNFPCQCWRYDGDCGFHRHSARFHRAGQESSIPRSPPS